MDYEKWVWIELIGFDNTESDFGVTAYMNTLGFSPNGISLLLFTPDFVHAHKGMEQEYWLPVETCSYAARPYGKLRNRQEWTNYQLLGLVKELQKHGIDIYCSFFNLFLYRIDGQGRASEWCAAHPELYEMRKTGEAFPVINPLKRLKDGTYYEDLFIRDLTTVMRDYNFDGYHGADGYTSPRLSLAEADYSDDMVGQFIRLSGVELAEGLKEECDGVPQEMEKRGDWIWEFKRMEWIRFYADRWGAFWQKIMPALRKEGKKAVLNSVWTRDPFEALYRYGVDYRLLAASGVDGFVVESVAASCSAGAGEIEYEPGTEFMAMLMTIKAYVPDMKLICLNAIQDTNEQWDAISHAPTVLERDIFSFSNIYLQDREGVRRCSSGFVACLGDGISRDSWEWILKRWNLGYKGQPESVIGASFVWSDNGLNGSLEEYPSTRDWPAYKFLMTFIDHGAPLHTMVNVNDLDLASGMICVTGLHLLPEEELTRVLNYRNGPSLLIGKMTERISQAAASAGLNIECKPDQLVGMVRDRTGAVVQVFSNVHDGDLLHGGMDDLLHLNDAKSWVEPLYFSKLSGEFLNRCVQTLAGDSGAPISLRNEEHIRTTTLEIQPGRWRILIRNLHMNYKTAHLDVGRAIAKVSVLTDFPGIPIFPVGSEFSLYVPGRGMVIVEIEF
ncbi:hypothetical protein [Paenibacillus mendelii]|uniref:Uncharacterized protein n=1 Tax=Paenibacillus mendelii TaxID=206163 RepID=A0ABV6J280_9BACL|nr:hypothetical protein [Paenibacillus mendelii]MCQ6562782.1 hypothetical protein [Paenibacillus mendelii]